MAAGVPLVAAGVGGVPDIVTAEEAILVPPEDPDRLAAALDDALHDPGRARRRAEAARRRLDAQFAAGPWLAAYEAVYGLAVEGRASRGAVAARRVRERRDARAGPS